MRILPKGALHSGGSLINLSLSMGNLNLGTGRNVVGRYTERRQKAEDLRQHEMELVMAGQVEEKKMAGRS